MSKRINSPLLDIEKLWILSYHSLGLTATEIEHRINRSESTIRSFLTKFKNSGQFHLKCGHRFIDRTEKHDEIVRRIIDNPRLTCRALEGDIGVTHETIREIRHAEGLHYYECIPIPNLLERHKRQRIQFCTEHIMMAKIAPIIFTNESTVGMNMNAGGLWRYKDNCDPKDFSLSILIEFMSWQSVTSVQMVLKHLYCIVPIK
jgi:transposase